MCGNQDCDRKRLWVEADWPYEINMIHVDEHELLDTWFFLKTATDSGLDESSRTHDPTWGPGVVGQALPCHPRHPLVSSGVRWWAQICRMWFGLPGDDLPAEAMPATRVAVPCARGRGPASSLPGHGGAGRRGLHPTSPFTISSVAPIRIPHPVSAGTGENEHNVRGRANSLFVNLYCPFIRHIKYALPSSVITFNFSSLLCHIIMHFPYSSDAGPPNIFFYSQHFICWW
jgi:hypothetical protein